MKIMYIVYSFTTGGTEKLLTDICNEMVKKSNDVFLYVVNNHYTQDMLSLVNKNVHIELENREIGDKNILKTMKNISKFIKKNDIEIVHCNSLNSPELLLISKIFNPKIKIFYTIHGMNQYKQLSKIRKIYRNLICNNIIAISNCVKKDIVDNGASFTKTITIYNALETNKFTVPTLKEFNKKEPILGNVARIMPEVKGQDVLISAISKLKNNYPSIKCYFAGATSESDGKSFIELKKQVKQRKLEENVFFVGNVKDVTSFLNKIDIFVLPSRFEGFGLSLVEAMCMGVPIIASNIDGPSEIIKNEGYGKLFKSEDSNELALKIKDIIENYGTEKKIALKNVEKVRNKYNIVTMCDELQNIYGG